MIVERFNIFRRKKKDVSYMKRYVIFVYTPSFVTDEVRLDPYLMFGYIYGGSNLFYSLTLYKILTEHSGKETEETFMTAKNTMDILYSSEFREDAEYYWKKLVDGVEPYRTWFMNNITSKYNI